MRKTGFTIWKDVKLKSNKNNDKKAGINIRSWKRKRRCKKREKILNVIEELFLGDNFVVLKDAVKEIDEGTSLISDLALDSLQILNFIVLLERKFSFSCEEDEYNVDLFDNVFTLIDFIIEKLD